MKPARRADDWRALVEASAKLLRERRTWQPAECRAVLWADQRLRTLEKLFGQVRVELTERGRAAAGKEPNAKSK